MNRDTVVKELDDLDIIKSTIGLDEDQEKLYNAYNSLLDLMKDDSPTEGEVKEDSTKEWICKETSNCLPTELNILGMKYDVILTEDYNILNIHGKLANGIVDNYQRKIWISTRMNYESMVHTLVHEVIHIIEWIYDRHNERTDLTEWQIDMIASGVLTLILNNDLSKIKR